MSVVEEKLSEYLSIFSKNFTIKTIIMTLMILFFNWSKSRIIKVDSLNFECVKSIQKLYKSAKIIVIDSNSPDKTYFQRLKQKKITVRILTYNQ